MMGVAKVEDVPFPIDSAASEDAFRAIVAAFSREKVSR